MKRIVINPKLFQSVASRFKWPQIQYTIDPPYEHSYFSFSLGNKSKTTTPTHRKILCTQVRRCVYGSYATGNKCLRKYLYIGVLLICVKVLQKTFEYNKIHVIKALQMCFTFAIQDIYIYTAADIFMWFGLIQMVMGYIALKPKYDDIFLYLLR